MGRHERQEERETTGRENINACHDRRSGSDGEVMEIMNVSRIFFRYTHYSSFVDEHLPSLCNISYKAFFVTGLPYRHIRPNMRGYWKINLKLLLKRGGSSVLDCGFYRTWFFVV